MLKCVFSLDLERCRRCQLGSLRIIVAITYQPIIRRILRHLKLVAGPPPLTLAPLEQGRFAWVSPESTRDDWGFGLETRPGWPAQSDTVAAIVSPGDQRYGEELKRAYLSSPEANQDIESA